MILAIQFKDIFFSNIRKLFLFGDVTVLENAAFRWYIYILY